MGHLLVRSLFFSLAPLTRSLVHLLRTARMLTHSRARIFVQFSRNSKSLCRREDADNKAVNTASGALKHLKKAKRPRCGPMDGRTDGRTDGWTYGWMDGRIDRPNHGGAS